jgi:hypothetical protein
MGTKMFDFTGSICSINGFVFVYVQKPNLIFHNKDGAAKVRIMSLYLS